MQPETGIFSTAITLFLLIDSIGNVPLFLALLKEVPPKRQKIVIFRELLIALAVISFFYFVGSIFLKMIHVKQHTVLIGGGVILFLISIRMVFPEIFKSVQAKTSLSKEPFIVPLAIPLVAGPAVLSSVMLYSDQGKTPLVVLTALFLAWLFSTLILLNSRFIQKILRDKGLAACEKLMGLLLTLIAIQMALEGISLYLCQVNESILHR